MAGKKKPRNQTERQQTEEKLLETEEMYRNLVERANDGIIVVQDMVIKYVNPRLTEMIGYTVEEMTGSKFSKFLVPEELAKQTVRYKQRMAGKNIPSIYETVILLNDGRRLEVELNAGIIQYEGKPANLAFIRDISYRKRNERDLRESDEKLRGIFSSIDDLIFGCDENGKFVYYHSPLGAKLYVPAEEFLGKKYSEVLPPRITKQINIGFKKNKKKKPFEFEYWLKMEGEKYWFSAKMSPVFIEDEFKGFVALIRDVTERKQVERELIQHRENLEELVKQQTAEFIESEERWRSLAENAPDIVIVLDLEGRISYINRVVPGLEKEEVVGKNQYEYILPEHHDMVKKTINDVIKTGLPGSYAIQGTGPEGKISWYNTQVGPLKAGSDVNGVVLFIQDITEQKLVEEALRESEEKYRNLFEFSPDAILLIGLDGSILECNEAATKLLGVPEEKLMGTQFFEQELIFEEDLSKYMKKFDHVLKGDEVEPFQIKLSRKGDITWIEGFPTVLKKDGKINALQVIARDVTERKKTELEMRRRLLKFDLDEGNTYLVKEVRPTQSLSAFKELLEVGYPGLIISRSSLKNFRAEIGRFFEYMWLSEKGKENFLPPKAKEIEKQVNRLSGGQAILIDGLEYLISKMGFDKTLSTIQSIREIAYLQDHIIILSIDPSTVNEKELRLLEKETLEVASQMALGKMPGKLLEMLQFVNDENSMGVEPSYSDVGTELELSKPTARKRIRRLVSMGCLKELSKGRSKYLDITEKGKSYMVLK